MKSLAKTTLLLVSMNCFSQIGVNTTTPTETLDINGKLRVRSIEAASATSKADSIIVTNNDGVMSRINSRDLLKTALKTAVKGNFNSNATVVLNLMSSQAKIPFDFTEFDLNNEFSHSTNHFTAKQNGIYQIFVQVKTDNTIGVSTNFGVAIHKNGVLINRNSFAQLEVLGTKVTPPIRSIQNLVQLNTGDTISFFIVSTLSSVNLIGDKEDTFFSIQQVR